MNHLNKAIVSDLMSQLPDLQELSPRQQYTLAYQFERLNGRYSLTSLVQDVTAQLPDSIVSRAAVSVCDAGQTDTTARIHAVYSSSRRYLDMTDAKHAGRQMCQHYYRASSGKLP